MSVMYITHNTHRHPHVHTSIYPRGDAPIPIQPNLSIPLPSFPFHISQPSTNIVIVKLLSTQKAKSQVSSQSENKNILPRFQQEKKTPRSISCRKKKKKKYRPKIDFFLRTKGGKKTQGCVMSERLYQQWEKEKRLLLDVLILNPC